MHEGSALSLVASSSARPLGAVFIGSVAGMLTMGCFSQLGERPTDSAGSLQVFGRCVGCPACAGPRLKRRGNSAAQQVHYRQRFFAVLLHSFRLSPTHWRLSGHWHPLCFPGVWPACAVHRLPLEICGMLQVHRRPSGA